MFHLDENRRVITIAGELPDGRRVDAEANISDGLLVWKFKDASICKMMFYKEKETNKNNVKLFERLSAFAITYPDMNKKDIEDMVKHKLEAQGLSDFTMEIVDRTEKKFKNEYH